MIQTVQRDTTNPEYTNTVTGGPSTRLLSQALSLIHSFLCTSIGKADIELTMWSATVRPRLVGRPKLHEGH